METSVQITNKQYLKIIKSMNGILVRDKYEIRDHLRFFIKIDESVFVTDSTQIAKFTNRELLSNAEDGFYQLTGRTAKDSSFIKIKDLGDFKKTAVCEILNQNIIPGADFSSIIATLADEKDEEATSLFLCGMISKTGLFFNIFKLLNMLKTSIPVFDIYFKNNLSPIIFKSEEDNFTYALMPFHETLKTDCNEEDTEELEEI
jgi:hypothetical protein